MAENVRNIDLGGPADPRAEWPVLPDPAKCPVVWKSDGSGEPAEYRLVGWYATRDCVVLASRSSRPDSVPLHERWWFSGHHPAEVYATREEAALRGLGKVRDQLEKLTKTLLAITQSAADARLPRQA